MDEPVTYTATDDFPAIVDIDGVRVRLDRPLSADTLIVRGENCRRPEKRNDMALLETKSGDCVMLDAHAVRLACLALGIVVKR